MASTVKMSSKHQIVVPREARELLGITPGTRLLVSVRDDVVELRIAPEDIPARLEGLFAAAPVEGGLWPELETE
jgi:AbrB family looped-hinge helix DNA binding protein